MNGASAVDKHWPRVLAFKFNDRLTIDNVLSISGNQQFLYSYKYLQRIILFERSSWIVNQ